MIGIDQNLPVDIETQFSRIVKAQIDQCFGEIVNIGGIPGGNDFFAQGENAIQYRVPVFPIESLKLGHNGINKFGDILGIEFVKDIAQIPVDIIDQMVVQGGHSGQMQ